MLVLAILTMLECTPARVGGGALDPRFVAVHNTLSAMGMAQVGPILEGTLGPAGEVRASLSLPAGCVTIVALGGEGIRDLDATLLDPHGAPIAHDVTSEPQAALRPCLESADTYVLVVKAASGAGSWIAATWAGGATPTSLSPAAGVGSTPAEANGTCVAPIPLVPGVVTGSTTHGGRENSGSCGSNDSRELGRELVYELEAPRRERVTIEVEAHFDSVLYIRKDDCSDPNAEVDCNDDAGQDRTHSRLERVLEPGKYFVFVDGYAHEAGPFKMTVTTTEVLALADVCRRAPALVDGSPQFGTTVGMVDEVRASCGGGAEGPEAVWQAELGTRSRVRIVEHSDDFGPVVHVRRSCVDEQSEMACGESGARTGDAAVTGVFAAGRYAVFADAHERQTPGRYALLFETAPPGGGGTVGDGCGDAVRLPSGSSGVVEGDTFNARDDVAGSCGGSGAADVVYRVDVSRRSRLAASLDGEEAPHVLTVWRRCADRSTEVACGRAVDEVVPPGSYYIGVDGASADALGHFTLQWALHDLTGQGAACGQSTTLAAGRSIDSTTVGAADDFDASCSPASGHAASGPDRAFKIIVSTRATIRLTLAAPTFDAVLSLRKACADPPSAGPVELACLPDSDGNHRTVLERTLEPGTYWVVVDGVSPKDQGAFTLGYRILH